MERPQTISKPSALAGTAGECLAEFMGTMVLILFGCGSVATFALFVNNGPGGATTLFANTWPVIMFGWGLAVMLGIYVAGAVSGAHINPAVTLAFAVRGKFPWTKVLPYWGSQIVGAFVGAMIIYLVYQGAITHFIVTSAIRGTPFANIAQAVGGVFYTSPQPYVGTFGAFCSEFLGTALLVGLIFAIVDARNQPVQANLNPLIIGLLIVAIGTSFGLNTGYAINPARDFGPRLFIALVSGGASFTGYTWIPIVAPLLGGIAGALIYEYTVGKVLEARGALRSGDTVTRGESVREPAVD